MDPVTCKWCGGRYELLQNAFSGCFIFFPNKERDIKGVPDGPIMAEKTFYPHGKKLKQQQQQKKKYNPGLTRTALVDHYISVLDILYILNYTIRA